MRKLSPWWKGTLGTNRIRMPYSITLASRKRRIRYETNMDREKKPCIWRCKCGRWTVNVTRVRLGNRRRSWKFVCSCGIFNHMNSEKSQWVENQIEAWTVVSDFRSIEEEAAIPDKRW